MSAVMNAAFSRRMVPVLWDTGSQVSRRQPYAASDDLPQTLRSLTSTSLYGFEGASQIGRKPPGWA
jgi:hypothetical protein